MLVTRFVRKGFVGLFLVTYLWVVRDEHLNLGLHGHIREKANEESRVRVWQELVLVERVAHEVRLEPGLLFLNERGDLPGCLLDEVVLQLSFEVGDVVAVHVVGDEVSFAPRQQLLLRVRDRV